MWHICGIKAAQCLDPDDWSGRALRRLRSINECGHATPNAQSHRRRSASWGGFGSFARRHIRRLCVVWSRPVRPRREPMSQISLRGSIPFGLIGPLIGKAFDRAVMLVLRRWKVLVGAFIVGGGCFIINPLWAIAPAAIFLVYWAFNSLAEAIRVTSPHYRMNGIQAMRVGAVNLVLGIASRILFHSTAVFAFAVIPVAWLLSRFIAASVLPATDDLDMSAFGRSWQLTTGNLWQSVTVLIAIRLALFVPALVAAVALASVIKIDIQLLQSGALLLRIAFDSFVFALCFVGICYIMQAQSLTLVAWKQALEKT